MQVGTGIRSGEDELERKNNCEVYDKCNGVLRGQTEGFSEC